MRLKTGHLVLFVLAALGAAVLVLDGSQRRPVSASSGSQLLGEAPGLAPDDRELSVMQFNIDRGMDAEGEAMLERVAECLKGAELIGLNEVDGTEQAAVLAETLDQGWVFGASEMRWWREHFGNAVLSALPAESWKNEPLPHQDADARRGLITVTFAWRSATLTLLVTHIDSGPDRERQLVFLAERFSATPAPKILLADLNVSGDHPLLRRWIADPALVTTTGPQQEKESAIDWIVAEGFALKEDWRCRGVSDHPAVGARLEAQF